MNQNSKTDVMSMAVLVAILLLVIEITFFNKGLLFSAAFSAVLIYIGIKRLHRTVGKLFFFLGGLFLFFLVVNMFVFKFFVVAVVGYVIYSFVQSKKQPIIYEPIIEHHEPKREPVIVAKPVFQNIFYGNQKTPNHVYEWTDITLQAGIGDTKIDLSNTVLPKGESVIAIRNFVGNIQILVPYDLEVAISHSVIFGSTQILGNTEEKLFNQNLVFRTEQFHNADQRLKISTSIGFGKLEVKRV